MAVSSGYVMDLLIQYKASNTSISYALERRLLAVDGCAFCIFHTGELVEVPNGVEKGYPTQIDFDALPQRIKMFEGVLKLVIEGAAESHYREVALEARACLGPKAATPMGLMNRFENLQVIII